MSGASKRCSSSVKEPVKLASDHKQGNKELNTKEPKKTKVALRTECAADMIRKKMFVKNFDVPFLTKIRHAFNPKNALFAGIQ